MGKPTGFKEYPRELPKERPVARRVADFKEVYEEFPIESLGLSSYTARFADFDATLDFDPKAPAASHVKAIINPLSVRTDNAADPGWDKRIGQDMMKGADFPQIVFESATIETTGPFTGKVTGKGLLAAVMVIPFLCTH